MSLELIISYVFTGLGIYLLIGVGFAFFFVIKGASQIDNAAQGISFWTKLLLFPASVALWAFLLPKWLKRKEAE